jgi:hypothetical protein
MASTEVTLRIALVDHAEFMELVEAAIEILRADEDGESLAGPVAGLRRACQALVDSANARRHEYGT